MYMIVQFNAVVVLSLCCEIVLVSRLLVVTVESAQRSLTSSCRDIETLGHLVSRAVTPDVVMTAVRCSGESVR